MDYNLILTAITSLGLPTGLLLYYLWKSDKDKKDYNDRLEKKDLENRSFTNELVGTLRCDIVELKEERKTDKESLEIMLKTNAQLSDTNAKLYNRIDDVNNKIDGVAKKVDKIEILVERFDK